MADPVSKKRLRPPLMFAFREAHLEKDAKAALDLRGDGRQEFRFDLGNPGLHRLAPLDRGFDGNARIGLERTVERGKGRPVDFLAKRAVFSIAFGKGVPDRFFDRVQAMLLRGLSTSGRSLNAAGRSINCRLSFAAAAPASDHADNAVARRQAVRVSTHMIRRIPGLKFLALPSITQRNLKAPPSGAALAQSVEHRIRNARVACSSHAGGTTPIPKIVVQ